VSDLVGPQQRRGSVAVVGTFEALGYRFGLRSEDQRFAAVVNLLYGACVSPLEPEFWYEVRCDGRSGTDRDLFLNDEWIATIGHASWLLGYFVWHVNSRVIEHGTKRYILLHAAAATVEGTTVLLPGAAEAGKTTLVAGLMRNGASYVTDEAVAIDPVTREVLPYPKPLSIDRGSWEILPELAPSDVFADYCDEQWRVPPDAFQEGAVADPLRPGIVVFPSYALGAATSVEPLTGAEALLELLRNTFRFQEHPRRDLSVLAQLLGDVACFRLRSGSLPDACAVVTDLVATDSTPMRTRSIIGARS
jgi:hypothetical protein